MNLASVRGPLLHLVLIQVCGLLAGHSQGPYLGGVVDQLVWPTLLQGYVVNLAPTHPPGQVTHYLHHQDVHHQPVVHKGAHPGLAALLPKYPEIHSAQFPSLFLCTNMSYSPYYMPWPIITIVVQLRWNHLEFTVVTR